MQAKPAPTINDIARLLGVHKSTVSRAMDPQRRHLVGEHGSRPAGRGPRPRRGERGGDEAATRQRLARLIGRDARDAAEGWAEVKRRLAEERHDVVLDLLRRAGFGHLGLHLVGVFLADLLEHLALGA